MRIFRIRTHAFAVFGVYEIKRIFGKMKRGKQTCSTRYNNTFVRTVVNFNAREKNTRNFICKSSIPAAILKLLRIPVKKKKSTLLKSLGPSEFYEKKKYFRNSMYLDVFG